MATEHSTEEWRPVLGWAGIYSVSSLGRIRRDVAGHATYAGRILTLTIGAYGYRQASLYYGPKFSQVWVHRVVAAAFLGPICPGHQVDHKDGVKTNNEAANLRYVTQSENARNAVRLGLIRKGERHPCAKLSDADVADVRDRLKRHESQASIALHFGVNQSTVSRIRSRKRWDHLK